jgi:hypothetical protein
MKQETASLFHAFEHRVCSKFTPVLIPAMVACCLATHSRAAVIPGGDFQLYQPGSTTVTAELTGGYVPWSGVIPPTNLTVGGGTANYSDSTTGTTVDLSGWSKIQGNADLLYNGPGGSMALSCFAAWGGDTRVETTGSLHTITTGESIAISVDVSGGPTGPMSGPLAFHLYANGTLVTPSTSVNVSGEASKTISRTYDPAALASHIGATTKIVLGVEDANNEGNRVIFDNVSLTAFVDSTPPTLTSFVDDQGGSPVLEYRPVTYSLTFSEAMNASTINTDDFDNNDVNTAVTINSVAPTGDPAVFLVTVTPTEAGTLHLQIKAGATLKDTGGVDLDTSSANHNDTPILVTADTDAPTLTSMVDDKSGGPIVLNQTVTYTVTFSEAMNASTVDDSDFGNSYPTATTINSVAATSNPKVFLVQATPGAAGSLQLQIQPGATLTDLKGNAMDSGSGVTDDTTIVVNALPNLVCPLGVLNFSANGGINPSTGNVWQAGDKYRLIFVTSGLTPCVSTDISTYNAFVQGLANGSTAFPALDIATWKVVGSTATVAARDNTGTNPGVNGTGEPVFRMDGSFAVANNYADLWNGIIASHVAGQNFLAVHLDENGVSITDERVRTGSNADGTSSATQMLGSGGNVQTGRNFAPDFYGSYGANSWMADWNAGGDGRVYALSDPITLQLAPGNTFTAWADANNASNQTPSQDHDNDGVDNGIEYFMGQTGSSFTAMPGLDGNNTVTWTMNAGYEGTYEVQTSPDLGIWTNVVPRPLPSDGNLSHTLPQGLGKRFVRLLVTPAP